MSTSNKLKAYVRFDGSGRVVPSSVILARFKPKVGNYQEIDSTECCEYVPTTTTTTTAGVTYTIGQAALGGIIAYINGGGTSGTSGLVAATEDFSSFISIEWGCEGTSISGANGTAIGTGNQNTIDIMAGCPTAGIAARLCGDLVQGGYSDWYLPSKDELNQLYLNQVAIGGFTGSYYWSSSEVDSNFAWQQDFFDGTQSSFFKSSTPFVRAVRSF